MSYYDTVHIQKLFSSFIDRGRESLRIHSIRMINYLPVYKGTKTLVYFFISYVVIHFYSSFFDNEHNLSTFEFSS